MSRDGAAELARRWLDANLVTEVPRVWPSDEPLRVELLPVEGLQVRTDAIVALRTTDGRILASYRVAPPSAGEIWPSLPGIWAERLEDPTVAIPASAMIDGRIRLEIVVAELSAEHLTPEFPLFFDNAAWARSGDLDEARILARRDVDEPLPVETPLDECVEVRRDDVLAALVGGFIRATVERRGPDADEPFELVLVIDATLLPSVCLACSARLVWPGGEAALRDLFIHDASYSAGASDAWAVLTLLELPPSLTDVLRRVDPSECRLILRGEPRLALRDSSCRAAWEGEVSIPLNAVAPIGDAPSQVTEGS